LTNEQKIKLIEPLNEQIPIIQQCQFIGLNRSNYYYQPVPASDYDLFLMNKIDEIYTEQPYYGYRKITKSLERQDLIVNHKKIQRLMGEMGLQAIRPERNTSKPHPAHPVWPYLLRTKRIICPNQVWGTDITFIRGKGLWFYLVAILDWYSRYVLSWQLSRTLTADFCMLALDQALTIGTPEIHNSDQGSQFTSFEYIAKLQAYPEIQISMDGRGRCFDNIFTERLWRNVKYEEVYLKDYQTFAEAQESLNGYFNTYNTKRLHESLNYRTPAEVYFSKVENVSHNR